MGNYRFKPANMMPNTWFYRLKDMSGTRNQSSNSVSSKKKQFPAATTATQPSKPKQPHQSYPRKSYYYTRECHPKEQEIHNSPAKPKATVTHFPHSPRTSSRQRVNRKSKVDSPKLVSARCNCPATAWTKSDSPPDYSASLSDSSSEPDSCDSFPPEFRSDNVLTTKSFDKIMSLSGSYNCKLNYNAEDDAINVAKRSLERKFDKLAVFDNMSNLDLPPIITKQVKFDEKVKNITKKETSKEANKNRKSLAAYAEANAQRSLSLNIDEKEGLDTKARKKRLSVRRHSVTSPGVRLRVNSPRLASRRRVQGYGQKSVLMSSSSSYSSRRSLSNSLAIVKFSLDPQRDFRDSMVDMIVENNISSSKDLEDLLACYLSLNSDEYHDLIIKVFKQIWLDLTHFQQK